LNKNSNSGYSSPAFFFCRKQPEFFYHEKKDCYARTQKKEATQGVMMQCSATREHRKQEKYEKKGAW